MKKVRNSIIILIITLITLTVDSIRIPLFETIGEIIGLILILGVTLIITILFMVFYKMIISYLK